MPRGTDAKSFRDAILPTRKRVDTLLPAAWSLPKGAGDFPVTTCRIDAAAHGRLVAWTQRKLKREGVDVSVILRGLHEMIAYFVPEASFATVRQGCNGDPASLTVTFTGDRSSDPELRARMRAAIAKWLEITFDESVTDRLKAAEIVMKDECWRLSGVSGECRWNKGRTCSEVVDGGLWDALAAHAVSALSGLRLRSRDGGIDRWLIPTRPRAGGRTYDGIELMAFPLEGSLERGFYTEVVTVATATYPEREGVHLIMRPSMRSWGKFGGGGDETRVLDVFMPGMGAGDYGGWRHSSFEFVGHGYEPGESKMQGGRRWMWKHDTSRKVMGVLGSLTELNWIAEDVPVTPIDVPGEYSVMPRLGTVHGDKDLPGGSGIGWHDRHDIVSALSPCLEAIGLERAGPMQRMKQRLNGPIQNIFKDASRPKDLKAPAPLERGDATGLERVESARKKLEEQVAVFPAKMAEFERLQGDKTSQRRGALRSALIQLNGIGADTLEMFVFTADDSSPGRVATHLRKILGQPTEGSEEDMVWHDGNERLRITLRVSHPGSLSERMDWITLPEAESTGPAAEARRRRERRARQDYWKTVRHRMEVEVEAARDGRRTVACAILEMPAGLDKAPSRDPYTLAKQVLASRRILVQPMFVTGAVPRPGSKDEKEQQAKYEMSARDCLRMLGVVTADKWSIAPAAIHVVQKGKKMRGATTVIGQAVPLAARISEGVFEVALPDAGTGEPIWMAYGEAVLRVMSGDYTPLSRSRSEENRNRFLGFFAQALRDIAAHGPSLVLAEQGGTTQFLRTLQNGNLEWDVFRAGTTDFSPAMLPGMRIVRTNTSGKLPRYCQDIEPESDDRLSQWPSGLFTWGASLEGAVRRTGFSLKTKPVAAQKGAQAMMVSRHGNPGSNQETDDAAQRTSAPLEELCAVFIQPEDSGEPLRLVDLADRWRGLHAAYDGDTRLPFPLHELKLIERAIVGELDD